MNISLLVTKMSVARLGCDALITSSTTCVPGGTVTSPSTTTGDLSPTTATDWMSPVLSLSISAVPMIDGVSTAPPTLTAWKVPCLATPAKLYSPVPGRPPKE